MMVVSFMLVYSGNTASRGRQLEQPASLVSSLVAEPEQGWTAYSTNLPVVNAALLCKML
jgi:hypothetical protein